MSVESLSCPNCSAPLAFSPGDTAVTCSHCGSDVRITSGGEAIPFFGAEPRTAPTDDLDDVRRELAAGRKIEAIKLVREQRGLGLKEALDFVEAMERGEAAPSAAPASAFTPESTEQAEIHTLLSAGQKINAIKRYREIYDTSLAEAKAAVEAMERGEQPPEWIAPHSGRSDQTVDWPEIRRLVATGRKLEAIKRYRSQSGKSLEEALPVIDALPENRRSGAAGGGGCAGILLASVLFFLLVIAGCGQYVRTTEMHACAVEQISSNGRMRDALGDPIEVSSLLLVTGYSSETDFGGNTDRGAAYFVRVSGPDGRAMMYVEVYESSSGFFGIEANPVPNPNDFHIRASGQTSSCGDGL